ncbi:MAG: hypothetical protein JSW00_17210 [Thermoplasmata archaeon]|nr:MAG: hypothetical protein JSW00_17210 [Thermoplasmata archaeon]
MKNEIKRKAIGRIFAIIFVGIFMVPALAPSVVGDPCDVWERDAQNEISPKVLTDEVGIGTADPGAMLHVVGDVKIDSGDLNVDSGTFFVDESGNKVGIGTTNPAASLEVAGSAHQIMLSDSGDNYNERASFGHVDGANGGGYLRLFNNQEIQNVGIRSYGDSFFNGGNVGIGTVNPGALLDLSSNGNTKLRFTDTVVSTYYIKHDGGGDSLSIGRLTGGAAIESDYLTIDNGNVGIGTADPQRLLHLSLDGSPEIAIENSCAATDNKVWRIRGSSGTISNLHFETVNDAFSSATNVMTLLRTGNVGIGTPDPGDKLEVRGSIRLDSDSSDGPNVMLYDNTETPWEIDNYNGRLRFYRPGEEKMTINSDGNIGIGTSTTPANLNIFDDTYPWMNFVNTASGGTSSDGVGLGMTNIRDGFISNGEEGKSLLFQTKNAEGVSSVKLEIEGDGDVGIGRQNPVAKLEVAGENHQIMLSDSGDFYNERASIGHLNDHGGYLRLFKDDETQTVGIRSYGDSFFNGGNVGIGTTDPGSAKLAVMGGNVGIGTTQPDTDLHLGGDGILTFKAMWDMPSGDPSDDTCWLYVDMDRDPLDQGTYYRLIFECPGPSEFNRIVVKQIYRIDD